MDKEFRKSKYYRLFFLTAQFMIFGMSLWFAVTKGVGLPFFGTTVLGLSAISLWLKTAQQKNYACGERYRRLLFFLKNNDSVLAPMLAAEIGEKVADVSGSPVERGDDYYASIADHRLTRTLENLQESAYYTHRLADFTKATLRTVSLIALVVAVIYMLATLTSAQKSTDPDSLRMAAEISARILAFFVVGQYVELWFSFASLQKASEEVYKKCCDALSSVPDEEAVTQFVSTYDCSLATASPIPTWVWQVMQKKLNRGWDEIKASRKPIAISAKAG
jgi:hypothetical protein